MATEASSIVQKVWGFADVLRDQGVSYGDYVEQLTYLIFLKMAHERDGASPIPKSLDWATLLNKQGVELEAHYRGLLEQLSKQPGLLGIIFRKAQNKIQDPALLKRLVSLIEGETWSGMDVDIKGEIYEGLLEKNAEDVKTGAGQYFTPRPLIRSMVEVTRPEPGQTIHDPACGTGGFLISAHNYISQNYKLDKKQKEFLKLKTLSGNDIVGEVVRLCAMNLFLHGIGGETECPIRSTDSLRSLPSERFDFILTNPPFGKKSSFTIDSGDGNLSKEADSYTRDDFWATTSNKQLNFLQHVHSVLKIGGRAAVVVPDNVLFEGGAGEVIRKKLLDTCDVHTILRLPTGIFYAQGVKANVIFFDKKEASDKPWTKDVWFYDLRTNMHFTLKTNPLKYEHLEEFVKCYNPQNRRNRKETERFKKFVYDEIVQRDKVNLDIFWLKDKSLEEFDNLPEPDEIAEEIVENLETALEQFKEVE